MFFKYLFCAQYLSGIIISAGDKVKKRTFMIHLQSTIGRMKINKEVSVQINQIFSKSDIGIKNKIYDIKKSNWEGFYF